MVWVVTGASGFLGYHMCKYLLKKRARVRGVDLAAFEYDMPKVEFYQSDIRDAQLMQRVCRGADVVMHGAAALPRWPGDKIWDVNLNGTKTMLEAAATAGVKHFIFISTTAVYGIPKKHPIYETDPLTGVGPYGESKVAAERACEKYRDRMVVSILRPKTFVGTVRLGVFSVLFDWLYRGKKLPVIGNGENRYQLLDVDDLVEAIYLMSKLAPKKANDVYNVGATEFGTINSHMQTLLDYRGMGRLVHFPAGPVKLALRVLDKLHLSPLYPWAYDTLDKDHFVSVDKLVKLGWKPKLTSEQALLESYKWYEKHRDKIIDSKGVTHTTQWDQGVLRWFRDLFF
ncbi:NAD(P)-dependent oxidoreductase [Candidatus Bathyarchaeota archaeon]|nr:NAD(P)-dependent oxidoreductase [Candidatus Bathyarchaeota archaeon]